MKKSKNMVIDVEPIFTYGTCHIPVHWDLHWVSECLVLTLLLLWMKTYCLIYQPYI